MISSLAVKKFLAQPRDDHRWLKKLTHDDLDALLDGLNPPPKFWYNLGLHQKVALYLGILYRSFADWLDMGTGKTIVALELLQYWWGQGLIDRALVFVTSDKAFSTWERQIKQYQISIPFVSLDGHSSVEKWQALDNFGSGIVLLHYPGTVAMVYDRKRKKTKAKEKRKQLVKQEQARLKKLLDGVDAVVYDESTRTANSGSLTHKLCRKVSQQAEFRYVLAGMPFGRDPTPIWAQMWLVDHGATLGETLGLFRAAFFNEKDSEWSEYGKEYTFKKDMEGKLSQILQHRSITYQADECIDLPPVRKIPINIKMPLEMREYYKDIIQELIDNKGNKRITKNAFLRMRQLSSGFIGVKDDETGERAQIEFDINPKREALLDEINNLPRNHKALVFYQYTLSGRRITEQLKDELGVKSIWLWSGTKNSRQSIEQFIEDPGTTVAVINNQTGAYSLDGLQVANYTFFFESPVSPIDRNQAERRTRRQGQKHRTCFFYDLLMQVEGGVDQRILDFHREGEDLFKALLIDPSKTLGLQNRK